MAIDLNKEHYNNSGGCEFQPKTVYPENNAAEEIYPQRELYPGQKQPDIKQTIEEKPPQNISEARPTVRVQYPAFPENSPPAAKGQKKGSPAVNILAFFLGGLTVLAFLLCMGAVLSAVSESETAAVSETAPPAVNVPAYSREYFSPAGVKQIIIKGAFDDLHIYKSDNGKLYTEIPEPDNIYAVSLEDGVLTVAGSAGNYGIAALYIPATYRDPVTIEAKGESNVYCNAGKNIKITAESGNMHVNDITGTDVEVTGDSSDIILDGCELSGCDLYTVGGAIRVENTSVSDKCTLYAEYGSIILNSSAFLSGVRADTNDGYVGMTDTDFSGASSVSSTNGGVSGTNFNFDDLEITCRNGELNILAGASVSECKAVINEENCSVEFLPEIPSAEGGKVLSFDLMNVEGTVRFKP